MPLTPSIPLLMLNHHLSPLLPLLLRPMLMLMLMLMLMMNMRLHQIMHPQLIRHDDPSVSVMMTMSMTGVIAKRTACTKAFVLRAAVAHVDTDA